MNKTPADNFFNDVDFVSIVDTIKNIYMSDGSMSTLLDFERVLDEADLYAFKNWSLGELVQGPNLGRYDCTCIFMWPYKLMPDPRGGLRLVKNGCKVTYGKSEIDVPVEIKSPDDFVSGGNYPKMQARKVWYVQIVIPLELMDDIKEGTIDLADDTIDLSEIEEAYDEDLDTPEQDDSAPSDQAMDDGMGDLGGMEDFGDEGGDPQGGGF